MDPLIESVGRLVHQHALIRPNASVVAAVSGGCDSVAMLHVLQELAGADERRWSLVVAHLDHGLRKTSDADARFVRNLAERLNVPVITRRRSVRRFAEQRRIGLEEAGRELRYQFLVEVAQDRDADCVAVAHHADDQAETILYRIVRGTHLRGLAGMKTLRPLADGVHLIRPVLGVRRWELEAYCCRQGLAWREDESNRSAKHRRNILRHEILTSLREKVNPEVEGALLRLGATAAEIEDYLVKVASQCLRDCGHLRGNEYTLTLANLASQPPMIRRHMVRTALERIGAPQRDLTHEHLHRVAQMADPNGPRGVSLPGGLEARRCGSRLTLGPRRPDREVTAIPDRAEAQLLPGGEIQIGGWRITCRTESSRPGLLEEVQSDADADQRIELLDADAVEGRLVCRPRRPGDRFHPLGATGRQSVSDFLTNRKLSTPMRQRVACLEDEVGIVYVAPLRIDDRVKLRPETRRVLRLEVQNS